jgi:hypothetical protein
MCTARLFNGMPTGMPTVQRRLSTAHCDVQVGSEWLCGCFECCSWPPALPSPLVLPHGMACQCLQWDPAGSQCADARLLNLRAKSMYRCNPDSVKSFDVCVIVSSHQCHCSGMYSRDC